MMMSIRLLISIALSFSLANCGGSSGGDRSIFDNDDQDTTDKWQEGVFKPSSGYWDKCGTVLDQNNWLRSITNEIYFWYDEVIDQDPANFSDPLDYFAELKTFELTSTGQPKDRFHYSVPTDVWLQLTREGIELGYGFAFDILSSVPPREIVVTQVEAGSQADLQGLKRGDRIIEADGVSVANSNDVDTLNNAFFPSVEGEQHSFVVEPLVGDSLAVTLTAQEQIIDPVPKAEIVATDSGNIGYLLFNAHNAPSEQKLISAIEDFQNAGIDDLVLDLRYNGGGYLFIANQLAYMIAGSKSVGNVFSRTVFSDKHPLFDPVSGEVLQPEFFLTLSSNQQTLPTLNLDRVYILTGSNTCSASEAIINGLRGIGVEVVQIGEATCGKPYGFYGLPNCGNTFLTVQFQVENASRFGDYGDGFTPQNSPVPTSATIPGCYVADDFSRELGNPVEARLKAALDYRSNGTCPAVVSSKPSSANDSMKASLDSGVMLRDTNAWRKSMLILQQGN